MTLSRARCKKAGIWAQEPNTAPNKGHRHGQTKCCHPNLNKNSFPGEIRDYLPSTMLASAGHWVFLYGGWGAAKQVTESGAFLAFLISTPHWSVWQEIKRASIEMSIQFDLKETRLAHCTFHFAQGMILIETTSDLSLVFMRGWKFVEISISTNFNRIRAIYIITAAGFGLQISWSKNASWIQTNLTNWTNKRFKIPQI